jgi:ferric-dicitrate binding protein FerR (iron transport regulator)
MSASSERVRELITEQAADWFVDNRAGVTDQERAEFAAWLKASPAHVEEYLGVATVSRDLRAACDTPDRSGRVLPPRSARHLLRGGSALRSRSRHSPS